MSEFLSPEYLASCKLLFDQLEGLFVEYAVLGQVEALTGESPITAIAGSLDDLSVFVIKGLGESVTNPETGVKRPNFTIVTEDANALGITEVQEDSVIIHYTGGSSNLTLDNITAMQMVIRETDFKNFSFQ